MNLIPVKPFKCKRFSELRDNQRSRGPVSSKRVDRQSCPRDSSCSVDSSGSCTQSLSLHLVVHEDGPASRHSPPVSTGSSLAHAGGKVMLKSRGGRW
ncbi:hypothetical protein CgunFtcFv8_020051 [Champsocephalus gunnari]|uniref:Uncharacterized protein n=1 Tax=Champsocephalus gunnari TaxID=52237 RepID=A0AAN8DKU6_CHAGU|nr:hypothetical protein CgunFtcFv8_020051 [Champsocephalus gunnari]